MWGMGKGWRGWEWDGKGELCDCRIPAPVRGYVHQHRVGGCHIRTFEGKDIRLPSNCVLLFILIFTAAFLGTAVRVEQSRKEIRKWKKWVFFWQKHYGVHGRFEKLGRGGNRNIPSVTSLGLWKVGEKLDIEIQIQTDPIPQSLRFRQSSHSP